MLGSFFSPAILNYRIRVWVVLFFQLFLILPTIAQNKVNEKKAMFSVVNDKPIIIIFLLKIAGVTMPTDKVIDGVDAMPAFLNQPSSKDPAAI